jgi:hypothetical protein
MAIYKNTPPIITNGLVLVLDAGSRQSYVSGSTTWGDLSGQGRNATLAVSSSGAVSASFNSNNQGSIQFSGTGSYATGSLSAFNVGCINMWINPDVTINAASSLTTLILLRYTGLTNSEWYIALGSATALLSNEYITVADTTTNTRSGVTDGGSLLANTWYNLTFNIETTYKIYVNGIKKTETTANGGVAQLTDPNRLCIGILQNPNFGFSFPGKVAITQLYNRALSAQEINQNYNALKSRFGLR